MITHIPLYSSGDLEYLDKQQFRRGPETYHDWMVSDERAQTVTLTETALESAKKQAYLYGVQAASFEDSGMFFERTVLKRAWRAFILQFHGNFRDTIKEFYWDGYFGSNGGK